MGLSLQELVVFSGGSRVWVQFIYFQWEAQKEGERVFVFECSLARRGLSWQHETFVIAFLWFVYQLRCEIVIIDDDNVGREIRGVDDK